uniref:Probable RNA-binding protein EIF1AD n=1 Tax=Strigamia maritima TaxID=126957 RepID=T1JA27_STRMM
MSKTTKKKHVVREVLDEFVLPSDNQEIVKVVSGRGNNLHEVESSSGEKFLASMPTKFRKNIWIKRGDFVIVEPIEEGEKVKAEIINILYKEQIKNIKQQGLWPKEFEDKKETITTTRENKLNSDEDLFVNTNRCETYFDTESSDSEESDQDI